jgi:hypothetical protein
MQREVLMERANEVLRALAAGALIYVVMAACSGKGGQDSAGAGVSGVDDAGSDREGNSGMFDALTDPVPEAHGGTPPEVATEPCNVTNPEAGAGFLWAVHAYAGKTVNDLSGVRALAHIPSSPSSTSGSNLPGFDYHIVEVQLKEGAAAVYCGGNYDSVTFILPN